MRKSRSPTQKALDNLIFRTTSRSKPKPKLKPSDIATYDAIYPLLSKRWLRVKARR